MGPGVLPSAVTFCKSILSRRTLEALIWYEQENKMIQECNAAQLLGRWKRRLWDQVWFLVLQRFLEWKSLERDSFLNPEASHSALTSPATRQKWWTCACVTQHSKCCGVLTEHDCNNYINKGQLASHKAKQHRENMNITGLLPRFHIQKLSSLSKTKANDGWVRGSSARPHWTPALGRASLAL